MRGKNKCRILKQIRQRIADENDIPYLTRECSYKGECLGTCPKCEQELRYLERELEKKKRLGQRVAVAAVAAGLSFAVSACTPGSGSGSAGTATEPGALPEIHVPDETLPTEASCPELEGRLLPLETEMLQGELVVGELPLTTETAGVPLPPEELLGDIDYIPGETWLSETEVPATTAPETTAAPTGEADHG